MIELNLDVILLNLSQVLQFLAPILAMYFSKDRWLLGDLAKAIFILSMIVSIPLISLYYPTTSSSPEIVMLYPVFAVGLALIENLPITVLLTCFLAEAHELPAHLLLRSNIDFMGQTGNLFHVIIIVMWTASVFYAALKIGKVKTDSLFSAIFISAFALNMLIYVLNPAVDAPPISLFFIAKRLIWFIALIPIFMRKK